MVLSCLQVLVAVNKVSEGDGHPELVWVGVWAGHLLCLNSLAAQFEILLGGTTRTLYNGRGGLVQLNMSHVWIDLLFCILLRSRSLVSLQ